MAIDYDIFGCCKKYVPSYRWPDMEMWYRRVPKDKLSDPLKHHPPRMVGSAPVSQAMTFESW